jgi:Restriction Enzyme Adenine Methylase Associated
MAIENRNLTAETRLVAKYKGQTYVCTVQEGEEGKLEYVLEDGKRFKSPSAAGSAVMGGSACNGWRFWTVEGDAPAAAAREPKGDATRLRAKGKKFIFRVPNQTGVAEGQTRFFCAACMKSFVARSGTAPENCPEGHRGR